ncbi:MAG: peptidylprolyl isomerase [Melioribacteraceae bacterium]|nr:peptidylprolyl isomerase [Melioribacteraceae bacterium]
MLINKIKISLIIFLIFGFSIKLHSQNSFIDETIADIEGEKITTSLFQELWEMSPHLNTRVKNYSLSEKINFLNTIIAYKLWYRNSADYRVDTSVAFSTAIEEIKKMYVRDALYKKEILDKITITNEELNSALKKQGKTLVVNYLLAPKEEEIKNLYTLLISGIPFDSLLRERDEYKNQSEPLNIKFGDYPEPIEEELFSLLPGLFSQPIQFRDGYYIFYLKNVNKKIWAGYDEQEKEKQKAEDVIKKRKENILYDSFMKNTLNGIKADVNRNMFKKLETGLIDAFAGKTVGEEKSSFITLSIDEFIKLKKQFTEEELNDIFITFSWGTISFDKCLRALYFNGLRMPSSNPEVIKGTFDTYIRSYIEMELLYRNGVNNGLQYSDEVKKYLKIWSEYYTFETIRGGMIDTVKITEDEIRNAYSKIYKEMNKNTFGKTDSTCLEDSSYENVHSKVKTQLAMEKIKYRITKKTADFAVRSKVIINYNVLSKMDLTNISSMTIRFMGFGGSISGVPVYTPNYEWTELLDSKTVIP